MSPPKVSLCLLPTPIHRLEAMSAHLDLDLWIKRDDLTGFAFGGNKGRKLEYLLADALAQRAEVVVTCGAAQSNFVRQLGAACALAGLVCAAAVMALPYEPSEPLSPPGEAGRGEGRLRSDGGNVALDRILGVDLRFHPDGPWETLYAHAEDLAREYEARGKRVYRIPIGGSSPLGAYAFHQAAAEVESEFDYVVTASSSGSTQVGLTSGFGARRTTVVGVCSDPEPEIVHDFEELAQGLSNLLGERTRLVAEDFEMDFDHVGPGYGIPSSEGDAAIARLARAEGVFLDPVYSGKAFAGLMAMAMAGRVFGRVLFWHTGGTPTLFAR